MTLALILLYVIVAFSFPYHKVPHNWRDVFTTRWWR